MMKKSTIYACLGASFFALSVHAQDEAKLDSMEMGSNYGNEVYYKFSDKTKSAQAVNDWHIGFTTGIFSQTVFINAGARVALTNVPNKTIEDFNEFTIVDTTGLATWESLYNDSITYSGAFDKKVMDEYSYGWGKYTGAPEHKVVGGPLYLLNFNTGTSPVVNHLFKIVIVELDKGKYTIRYQEISDVNATMQEKIVAASTYNTKDFVYFNLIDGQVKDRELKDWDIWTGYYHDQMGSTPNQRVNGVLHNPKYKVAKVDVGPGNQASHVYDGSAVSYIDNKKNVIGQYYKKVDYTDGSWSVTDSTVYYLKDKTTNEVWKWYPTKFESGATDSDGNPGTGKVVFMIQKIGVFYTPCEIKGDKEVCKGEKIQLTGTPAGQDWAVVPAGAATITPTGEVTGVTAGKTVTIEYKGGGCDGTAKHEVKIKDCSTSVGIDDLTTQFVDIYPNPASSQITLVFDSKASTADIVLKNQIGQVVFAENVNTTSGVYSQNIDLSSLTNGMYFVEIIQNGVPTVKTVVKN